MGAKKNKIINLISAIFVGVQLGFYIIIMGELSSNENVLTFLSVITSFVFSILMISQKKQAFLTSFALLFTVISDVFLMLVHPIKQDVAMTTFSIAQLLYCYRLLVEMNREKERVIHLIVRAVLCAVIEIIAIIVVGTSFDVIVALSVFYFANLVMNLLSSFRKFDASPYLAIGFLCFIMCDVVVGLSMAVDVYLTIPETSIFYNIAHPQVNLVHMFYVPSQTLIALSTTNYVKKTQSVFSALFKNSKN